MDSHRIMKVIAFALLCGFLRFASAQGMGPDTAFEPQGLESRNFKSFACVGFYPNWKCDTIQVQGWMAKASTDDALVVISHGSQGLDKRHSDYARYLQGQGINAVVLAHWEARGLGKIQSDYNLARTKGGNSWNMAIDAYMTMLSFRAQEKWSKTKFGYVGESMGGSAVRDSIRPWIRKAVNELVNVPVKPFDAVASLYPGCFDKNTVEHFMPVPMLFVLGEIDDDTPAELCKKQTLWINERGGQAEWVELKGQPHDYDAPHYWKRFRGIENSSKCGNVQDQGEFTLNETGKKYPATAEGYKIMWKDCVSLSRGDVMSGNTGNPQMGYKEWTAFFQKKLLNIN